MKQNVFKIKKNLRSKLQPGEDPKRSLIDSESQLSPSKYHNVGGLKLLEKIKKSKKVSTQNDNAENTQGHPDLHEKDKFFLVDLPSKENTNELTLDMIEKWFTKVCNQLFSISYNYLTKNVCSINELKLFMSQNMLKHFLKLTQETNLTEKHIESIEHHLQNKVIPYSLKKFTKNTKKQTNVLYDIFDKEVSAQKYQNDIFYNNKKFKVMNRENGNYNDLIMNVINHIVSKMEAKAFVESKSDKKQESIENIMKEFQGFISNIVYNQQKESTRKEKSSISVEVINAIPENIQRFDEQSIINRYFQSDNPFVLNILISWTSQLWSKFQNSQYYRENHNKFLNHRGKIIYLKDNCATALSEYLQEEAELIRKYLKNIKSKYYQYQSKIIKNIYKDDHEIHIQEDEKYIGKYTSDIVSSLSQLYSLYLNRLIHGLTKVSQRLQTQYSQIGGWKDGPLNLLSLEVVDLFKCKIKSDKQEILLIHDQLRKISKENPNQLRVIKIQERIQQGKSCLVEQIVFKQIFQCEIVLEITSQSNEIQKNYNIFYEILNDIGKSTFGSFDYFSRNWLYLDSRWQQFTQLKKLHASPPLKNSEVNELDIFYNINKASNVFIDTNLPFQCSYCKVYYFNNNHIVSNQKHKDAILYKCFRCRLEQMNNQEIRSILMPQEDNVTFANYALIKTTTMPKKGIAIPIQGKQARYEHFAAFRVNSRDYFLGKQKGKIYQVVKNNPEDLQNYLKNHYVFSLPDNFQFDEDQLITDGQVKSEVYLPNYLLWAYQDNQDSISLIGQNLSENLLQRLIQNTGYEKQRTTIKKVELVNNYIKNASLIFDFYPNISHLDLQNNSIRSITQKDSQNLKFLSLKDNDLFRIPDDISKLLHLEELDVSNNHIKKIQNLGQLLNLSKLNLSYNALKQLPNNIEKLKKLTQLNLQSNKQLKIPKKTLGKLVSLITLRMNNCSLNHFGDYIFNLTKLQLLDLSSNKITTIPERIQSLKNLEYLYINNNQISSLPLSISKLEKMIVLRLSHNKILHINVKMSLLKELEVLQLDHNKIQKINESLCDLVSLKKLLLHNNKLKEIPANIGRCNNLQLITLQENLLQSVTYTLKKCKAITYSTQRTLFNASCNNLKVIPNAIVQLPYLKSLELSFNRIVEIPAFISKLRRLEIINLNNNEIVSLPQQLSTLIYLKEIQLDNNKLEKLQDSIFQKLSQLELFNAENNRISVVSAFIFKNATSVNLYGNKIQELNVEGINQEFQIKSLNLNNNNIESIQKALEKFKKLKLLKLRNNKGKNLLQEVSAYSNKIKIDIEQATA